jgi:predicted phosphate transport protein (TIGR00153 family)
MSLKTFLQDRNNANTLEMAVAHMQKTLETVVEFERGFTIYVEEKNPNLALEIFKRVDRLENEADTLRRDNLMHISQSELSTQMREDLSHLVKRIDRIANTTDGAGRRISGIDKVHFQALGDDILSKMMEIIRLSVKATKILFNLIKKMPEMANQEIFRICAKIQNIEHECDILHSTIYEMLNKLESSSFNHFVAIQISNFVDMIETISDKVEDVSDYIEVLKTAKR